MSKKKTEFGDVIKQEELVKRTLMVGAFPALIRCQTKDGKTIYDGFLPGFEFGKTENINDENECVEILQDLLDDEVEELIVFSKPLPNIEDDDELLKKHSGYKIVFLDINVYATPEEFEILDGQAGCACCGHDCCDEDFSCDCHHSDEEDCHCHEDEGYCCNGDDEKGCCCHSENEGLHNENEDVRCQKPKQKTKAKKSESCLSSYKSEDKKAKKPSKK